LGGFQWRRRGDERVRRWGFVTETEVEEGGSVRLAGKMVVIMGVSVRD
jgi:hypothetical protein